MTIIFTEVTTSVLTKSITLLYVIKKNIVYKEAMKCVSVYMTV